MEKSLWSWIKANVIVFHLFYAYVFVVSGLIVCFLMLLAYLLIWPWNRQLYRKIVSNLAYSHWSQLTFLVDWWSNSKMIFHFEHAEDVKYFGHEHIVAIMNHKSEIDWLMAWTLGERVQLLGSSKIYGKQSLKYVPLIGWAMLFTETIFLRREWEKDRKTISRDLRFVDDQPPGYCITLLLCCEGTRFTEEKHKVSVEIAQKKGLPPLKHHLLPRPKGFVHSVHGLRGKVPTIVDLNLAFHEEEEPATLVNIMRGKPCTTEIFLRRVPLDSVPIDSDESSVAWLHEFYRKKDEIYENFQQNGRFTIGTKHDLPRRTKDLFTWLAWATLLSIPLFYGVQYIIISGSLTVQLVSVFIVALFLICVRYMIGVTEIRTRSGKRVEPSSQDTKKSE